LGYYVGTFYFKVEVIYNISPKWFFNGNVGFIYGFLNKRQPTSFLKLFFHHLHLFAYWPLDDNLIHDINNIHEFMKNNKNNRLHDSKQFIINKKINTLNKFIYGTSQTNFK